MKSKIYFKYDANIVGTIFILFQNIPRTNYYCSSFFTVLEGGKSGKDGDYVQENFTHF